jgi:hypothetical protein
MVVSTYPSSWLSFPTTLHASYEVVELPVPLDHPIDFAYDNVFLNTSEKSEPSHTSWLP